MNLLPKDHTDFSSKDYWNEFFSKQTSDSFEWYGEYDTLCEVIDKYIHIKDKVLVIGCGNSKLSADLYDVGIYNSVSIDNNVSVINQMKAKYGTSRPKLSFLEMDVFDMSFESEIFAVIVDKGTLDALLVNESAETMENIDKMFSEIERVLRKGGRYLCISLLQEHILKKMLNWFLERGWFVRIHRCKNAEAKHEDSLSLPVFLCVLTKMKKIPDAPMILELAHESTNIKRCSSKDEAMEYVKSAQHYAFLKHYLSKKKIIDEDICLELCDPNSGMVKYKMFVVDLNEKYDMKFAIFIVPQGREIEWLFSTHEGRCELATSAKCERLVVVHLQRDIIYKSLEEVKRDLSEKVLELAPHSCKSQVPILSLGDDVGKREIKCSAKSNLSGDYVVEDVLSNDDAVFRRLIFLNNPYLVQSEAKLIKSIQKKKKKSVTTMQIDFDYLACDHHVAIISGLAFLKSQMLSPKVLQIGLGGGTLAMYLYKHFPEANIDVVELDPHIVDVAKKWFSLVSDERVKIHIADGLDFIQNAANKGDVYDTVILDVDSKNPALGISSPPVGFLEISVLKNMCQLINNSGIVIMNLACRNIDLHSSTYLKLKTVFNCIYSRKIPGEVNEVIYCMRGEKPTNFLDGLKEEYSKLTSFLEKQTKYCDVFDTADLVSCLKEIL